MTGMQTVVLRVSSCVQMPFEAMAAAHVLQSNAALKLAGAAEDDASAKRMQLEARWAANSALTELSGMPEGSKRVMLPAASGGGKGRAATLQHLQHGPAHSSTLSAAAAALSEAEAARGKGDLALKAAAQAMDCGAAPAAKLLALAASLAASGPFQRTLAAKAVHAAPDDRDLWHLLRSTAAVT